MQQAWTIVPIRGLASGKTRLAAVLDADSRRQLCTHMLHATLDAVEATFGSLARCIVVSADPSARVSATARGAQALGDPPDAAPDRTLDAALDAARAAARTAGARRLLLLAADMPDIDAHALQALLHATPDGATVLIADKSGTGTNGMLLPAALPLRFAFGPGSLARHRRALAALGVDATCCSDQRLAFDIDTPGDLEAWTLAGGRMRSPSATAPASTVASSMASKGAFERTSIRRPAASVTAQPAARKRLGPADAVVDAVLVEVRPEIRGDRDAQLDGNRHR